MPFRVQDILLVSSLYDSFTLQEEGRLNELLLGEFMKLSLQQIPGLTHVSSGAAALARAEAESRFNLILTTINLGDMDASQGARGSPRWARRISARSPRSPARPGRGGARG